MPSINEAKQAVEAAQKQLKDAIKALEQVEENASKIGLKIPEMEEKYYSGYYNHNAYRTDSDTAAYLSSFDSTNKAQQKAFQKALAVMAEMRMQDGIVVPDGDSYYCTISFDFSNGQLYIDYWCWTIGISLFPAFETETAAQKAIDNVGKECIVRCIKTMMFMTPESRGEIE